MVKKIAFISLNIDSIGYATNTYPMKNDPAFKIAIPRIEKILDKYQDLWMLKVKNYYDIVEKNVEL